MRNPLLTMRIRPYQGHVSNPISNTYGNVRTQPVHGKPKPRVHQGWDLQAAPLTVVYAIADGEAEVLPYSPDGWGNCVRLKFTYHGRNLYAFYAHLTSVLVGNSSVKEGTPLGLTGMTGNARKLSRREAHLHFGIATRPNPRKGLHDYIDPGEVLGYSVYSSSPR